MYNYLKSNFYMMYTVFKQFSSLSFFQIHKKFKYFCNAGLR